MIFVHIIVLFVVVLFLNIIIWLFSNEDIGGCRTIIRHRVEAFWMYSAHAQWYASKPW